MIIITTTPPSCTLLLYEWPQMQIIDLTSSSSSRNGRANDVLQRCNPLHHQFLIVSTEVENSSRCVQGKGVRYFLEIDSLGDRVPVVSTVKEDLTLGKCTLQQTRDFEAKSFIYSKLPQSY